MNKNSKIATLLVLSAGLFLYTCNKDEDENPNPGGGNPTVKTARDSVIDDYNANYIGSAVTSSGWTGNTAGCNAGSLPQSSLDAVIKRINYFRRLVKLNDNCTLDSTKFSQEQEAALMMSANGMLSHAPPSSWLCYTPAGYTGAASSNLSLGSHTSNAITSFVNDFGSGNEPVGHRRWILHSTKTSFSCGSTSNAMALYVFGPGGNTQIPEFIPYPPKGYVPQQLVFDRWSFSIPGANFSSATVSMNGPSGVVSLTQLTVANGYGDNTIVWVPTGIDKTNTADITYTVTVSGISGVSQTSYTYNVILVKP